MSSIQYRMWLERAGLFSESKTEASFLHPSRGEYKLSHDSKNNIYNVHNKFGELVHTFSGHMPVNDISAILKDKQQMMLLGKLTEDYLTELKKTKSAEEVTLDKARSSASKEINTNRGSYNEAMLAHHLNGGKYIDNAHKEFADHHRNRLQQHDAEHGTNEVKTQEDRAKEQSRVFQEHAKHRGYEGIKKVHLTPKPGDIERKTGIKASQQENPSDVVVEFHKKPKDVPHGHLGLSAKSTSTTSGKIGYHNGGTGTIGNFLEKHLGKD